MKKIILYCTSNKKTIKRLNTKTKKSLLHAKKPLNHKISGWFFEISPSSFVYRFVTGLLATQVLMLGMAPTLSTRFLILGKLERALWSGRPEQKLNAMMSAQVRALPAKYWPPRLASLFSRFLRAFGHVSVVYFFI